MKLFSLSLLFLMISHICYAENANCGVNSAFALAQALGSTTNARTSLQAAYPSVTVSLADVKQMCAQQNIATQGVKATLSELLQTGTPSIIGLREPEHFTLLLDGNADEVRLIEGE